MKYISLTKLCKQFQGCNLLELPWFKDKEKCENFIKSLYISKKM